MSEQTRAEILSRIAVNLRSDGRHVDAAWLEKEIVPLVEDAERHYQTRDGVVVLKPNAGVFAHLLFSSEPRLFDAGRCAMDGRMHRYYSTREAAKNQGKTHTP